MSPRIKRWILAICLATGILIGGAGHVGARQTHPEPFHGTVHVVKQGETLWGIARRAYPNSDPRESIDRIARASHLNGGGIRAGQKVLLPSS